MLRSYVFALRCVSRVCLRVCVCVVSECMYVCMCNQAQTSQ